MKAGKFLLALCAAASLATAGCIIAIDGDMGYSSGDDQAVVINSNQTVYLTNDHYVTNVTNAYCTVTLGAPSDNAYVDGTFEVSGSADCPGNLARVMVFFESTNGAVLSAASGSLEGKSFVSTVSVSREGVYKLWTAAWDVYGSIGASGTITVTADWTPPVVAVASPASDSVQTTNGSVTFSGTASDTVSGVESVYVQTDGALETVPVCVQGTWNYTVELAEGVHTVRVYASDNAGHMSSAKSFTVTVISK